MPGTKNCYWWVVIVSIGSFYNPMAFYSVFYRTSERWKLQTSEQFSFKEYTVGGILSMPNLADKKKKTSITNYFLIRMNEPRISSLNFQ